MKTIFNSAPENVRVEQVYTLFKQSPVLFFGVIVSYLVVASHFWNIADHSVFIPWLVASFILIAFRVLMIRRFNQLRPQETAIKWGYIFSATAAVSGFLWGCLALFILDVQDMQGMLLVTMVFTVIVSGSLVPLSGFMPAHPLFSTFTLAPLAYVAMIDGSDLMIKIGFGISIYLMVMLAFSFIVNRNIAESISLRFENLDLMDDLRAQKKRADTANMDKSRFLAATSHDLRQPLHALDLYLGALKNSLVTNEQIDLLNKSRNSSRALGELLNALMDISKLDAGNVEKELKTFDVRAVLQELIDNFLPLAKNKGMAINLNSGVFFIESDPVLFARIIRNFLSNAISHNDSGDIDITVEDVNESINVSVTDHGKGISEEEVGKIFSEFYQLDNPERDRNKGLGLGLAIAKRVADILGYEIDVKSQIGKGSCFTVTVPKSEYISQEVISEEQPEVTSVEGLFIICIDDELGVQDALRVLLRGWGCEVLIADSEQSVLAELKKYEYPVPDLVISDYRLRDNKTGVEAIKALCEYYGADLPSIIVTGDTSSAIRREVASIKSDIMFKPVEPESLLRMLVTVTK